MGKRTQSLLKILSEINFLCRDIDVLIIEYDVKEWSNSACDTLRTENFIQPIGILCYDKHIYVCSDVYPHLICYNKNGQKVKEYNNFSTGCSIDMDEDKKLLYVVDRCHVWRKSLEDIVEHWERLCIIILPKEAWPGIWRGIKVDQNEKGKEVL